MKRVIHYCANILAMIFHVFVNRKLVNTVHMLKDVMYSSWVKLDFQACGSGCTFGGFSRIRGSNHIRLGQDLFIGKDIVWEVIDERRGQHFTPLLTFGNGSSFGDGGHISCVNKVEIGNGVRIGRKVFITDNSHGASVRSQLDTPPNLRPIYSKGPVVIEDTAWIGEMACIMPGVTIGRGAIIGANAVVTHDIPPYSVAAGNPARVIKELKD